MKKTKLFLLSVTALLGASALVGCGDTTTGGGHPGEESETVTEDNRVFNIYFDKELSSQDGNLEIANNSRFLLWKHVSVPKGTYVVEALTDNVKIDNHVIEATDFGPFKVKITATGEDGETKRVKSLSGSVVSPEKVQFNKLWDKASATGNYTVEGELHSKVRHSENFIEFLNGKKNPTDPDTYQGSAYDEKTAHWYPYAYSELDASKIEWQQGYGWNHDILGTAPGFKIKGSNFKEKFDSANNPTGEFEIKDTFSQYKESELLAPLFDNLFSFTSNYFALSNVSKATGLSASLDETTGGIKLVATRDDGSKINTFTDSGQVYDATVSMTDIGATTNTAIEAWLKNPTYVEQVNVSPLVKFFNDMETAKNYTVARTGMWLNPQTGQPVPTPQGNMSNIDGQGHGMHAYAALDLVDQDFLVNHVDVVDPTTIEFANVLIKDWKLPTAKSVNAFYVKNGNLHLSSGNYEVDQANGSIKYNYTNTVDSTQAVPSLWETNIPYKGLGEALSMVSFDKEAVEADGSLTYRFNTCGDDANKDLGAGGLILAKWPAGNILGGFHDYLSFLSVDQMDLNMNVVWDIVFPRSGKEFYFTSVITLDQAKGSLSVTRILAFSNEAFYVQDTTWSNVGATIIDDTTKALLK